MSKHLKMHNGYSGEIRLGKPGRTRVNRDGSTVHFVDESTWKNIKEQLGLTEENLKHNPMYEVIGRFENVPPHFRPENKLQEKQNDN
jgi:hypothetical protein